MANPRRAVGWLILITTLLRFLWAAALEPSNDESYHYLYTLHPDWSYFDHPPMMAWLAKLSLLLCGGVVNSFTLRFAFVLVFAGSIWVLFRWTARWFGEAAGFWSAAALCLTGYFTAFGGLFTLPDSPFLFFALFTYWQASEAVLAGPDKRALGSWLLVGLGFGCALLSKYHGVLLPGGVVLYALLTPGRRRILWSPGPYLAVAMGLAMFAPVLLWNANHEWASFRFQGGRAATPGTPFLHEGPVKWFFGPMLYLLPWIWFWLVVELVRRLCRFQSLTQIDRLLICLTIVPLAFFFVISGFSRSVLLHWPLVGFLPLYPLVGARWAKLTIEWPRAFPWLVRSWVFALALLAAAILLQVWYGPIRFQGKDPTADICGWASVARELDRRQLLEDPDLFLITNRWYDSGQLAFAIRNRRPVVCYNSLDARGFAFWSQPADWVGKTGLMVIVDEPAEPEVRKEYTEFFTRIEKVAEFPMDRGGNPFRMVRVYRCVTQLSPYPFTYKSSRSLK